MDPRGSLAAARTFRFRRFLRVRVFTGEGLLAEPIAGPQGELVFVPPTRPSVDDEPDGRVENITVEKMS